MITVQQLSKEYRIRLPRNGITGKVRSLFAPHYKTIKAVDAISFTIQSGEIIGYLGPNGAGKSTTIKLLTGVLVPTAGQIEVNGCVPYKNRKENAYNIGVVYGQRSQLWWDLPLMDSFEILAAMYRVPPARYKQTLDQLVDTLQMQAFLDQPVRNLSLGQKMRGDMAAALLHEPPILYLDEPTIGLDVVSKNKLLQFLRERNREQGTTILLTTHNLSDVEQLCPRILIIDHGKVILDVTREQLMQRFGKQRLAIVEFDHEVLQAPETRGQVVQMEANKVWIQFNRETMSAYDLIASLDRDQGILDVSIVDENVETIVGRIYENGLSGVTP